MTSLFYLVEFYRWDVPESWSVVSKHKTLKRAEQALTRLRNSNERRGGIMSFHVFESLLNASPDDYPLLLLTFKPPSIFRTSHME